MKSIRCCYALIAYLFMMQACNVTSEERSRALSSEGYHLISSDAGPIRPISLLSMEGQYLLYFSDHDSWKRATSNDLINWSNVSDVPLKSVYFGDIVADPENQSQLGDDQEVPLLLFYNDDGINARYSLDQQRWQTTELELPKEVSGNPRINRDPTMDRWIMTVTDDLEVAFLSSTNLLNWRLLAKRSLPGPAPYCDLLIRDEMKSILLVSGDNPYVVSGSTQTLNFFKGKRQNIVSGTFDQTYWGLSELENRTIAVNAIDERVLGIAKAVEIEEEAVNMQPVDELTTLEITKRRGRLSSLKGQKASRFVFSVEDFTEEVRLRLFNEQGEELILILDPSDETLTIDKTRSTNAETGQITKTGMQLQGSALDLDILIDFSTVEVFERNAGMLVATTVNPIFIYNQIAVETDGEKVDARAILYSLEKASD